MELFYPQRREPFLEEHRLVTFTGVELQPVVADQLSRRSMLGDGFFHRRPGGLCCEAANGVGADSITCVVVDQIDDPGLGSVRQSDLCAVNLP